MLSRIVLAIVALTTAGAVVAQDAETASAPFANDEERISYCIGVQLGKQLKPNAYPLNMDALVAGMKDAVAGGALRADQAAITQALRDYQQKAKEAAEQKGKELEQKAADYAKQNATAEGVKTTESGLQYKVIQEGTGATPAATDMVRVHYTGTLVNGEKFDSSYDRGEPAEFPVNGVIKGWTEALQLMKEGSKWQLVIPPALAYGANGTGPIPPNATLLFDVELIEVLKGSAGGMPQIEIK